MHATLEKLWWLLKFARIVSKRSEVRFGDRKIGASKMKCSSHVVRIGIGCRKLALTRLYRIARHCSPRDRLRGEPTSDGGLIAPCGHISRNQKMRKFGLHVYAL